jgi:hypothetical protein
MEFLFYFSFDKAAYKGIKKPPNIYHLKFSGPLKNIHPVACSLRGDFISQNCLVQRLTMAIVAFLLNFFISKEAATAERRYEKERQSVKLHAYSCI